MTLKESGPLIFVTGTTGYIGGCLIPRLVAAGHRVRGLVRDPLRLKGRDWERQVEIVCGDALQPESLATALAGVSVAYYLIHSMKTGNYFLERDNQAAVNFGEAARQAGVQRIIYLGGLGDPNALLSDHLRSRHSTGEALCKSGVPVIEFRAAMIVGSGSLSFELMRYLTERLPIILCPRPVYTRTQPIAISDILNYLLAALEISAKVHTIVEVGGSDVVTYREMMLGYARARGLIRVLIPVPFPTRTLFSSYFLYDTPIPASIARQLLSSLQNENIVRSEAAKQLFPHIKPMGYTKAIQEVLSQKEAGLVETV
jgi:uncharacterized protein YbjT (DUF2867 family)